VAWVPGFVVFGSFVSAGPAEGGIDVIGSGVGTFDAGAGMIGCCDVEMIGTVLGTWTAGACTLRRAGKPTVTPSAIAGTATIAVSHSANRPVTMVRRLGAT
jgi:hypothetical protein